MKKPQIWDRYKPDLEKYTYGIIESIKSDTIYTFMCDELGTYEGGWISKDKLLRSKKYQCWFYNYDK